MGGTGKPRQLLVRRALIAALVAAGMGAAWFVLGRERGETPAPVDAVALEQEASAGLDDPERLLVISERLRRAGSLDRAMRVLQGAFQARSSDPRFAAAAAELMLEAGQPADAEALVTQALGQAPWSPDLTATAAAVLLETGRVGPAVPLARRAVETVPRQEKESAARAWRIWARVAARARLLEEAWPAYERALALAPDDTGLLLNHAETLTRYGRSDEAERTFRRAVALRPQDPRALTLFGAFLAERAGSPERQREATTLLRRAARLAPRSGEPPHQLGRALLKFGDAAGAAAALEECLRIDPSLSEAWLPLGEAYRSLGRADDAERAFRQYKRFADDRREAAQLSMRLRREPQSVDLLLRMARLQERQGHAAEAARTYRQALRLRRDPRLAARLHQLERASDAEQQRLK